MEQPNFVHLNRGKVSASIRPVHETSTSKTNMDNNFSYHCRHILENKWATDNAKGDHTPGVTSTHAKSQADIKNSSPAASGKLLAAARRTTTKCFLNKHTQYTYIMQPTTLRLSLINHPQSSRLYLSYISPVILSYNRIKHCSFLPMMLCWYSISYESLTS